MRLRFPEAETPASPSTAATPRGADGQPAASAEVQTSRHLEADLMAAPLTTTMMVQGTVLQGTYVLEALGGAYLQAVIPTTAA